jgi:arginine deiminase
MHRSFKQQLQQKYNNLLLHNDLQESIRMEEELSDELNFDYTNDMGNPKHSTDESRR